MEPNFRDLYDEALDLVTTTYILWTTFDQLLAPFRCWNWLITPIPQMCMPHSGSYYGHFFSHGLPDLEKKLNNLDKNISSDV